MNRKPRAPNTPPLTVIQIRERAAVGAADHELAAEYGLSVDVVCKIRTGASFPRIGGPRTRRPRAVTS